MGQIISIVETLIDSKGNAITTDRQLQTALNLVMANRADADYVITNTAVPALPNSRVPE